jgi:hypothetical protein
MDDSWALGWTTVVALATGGLAVATFVLAFKTRSLADSTRDELVAQWRPALVPGTGDFLISYSEDAKTLSTRVRNAGRGPAAYIRVHLDPFQMSPANWHRAVLAPGEQVDLTFAPLPEAPPAAMQLLLDYRDLGGRSYASSLVITQLTTQQGPQELTYYDVRFFRDVALTPLGDSVAQPGLRPLPREHEG